MNSTNKLKLKLLLKILLSSLSPSSSPPSLLLLPPTSTSPL